MVITPIVPSKIRCCQPKFQIHTTVANRYKRMSSHYSILCYEFLLVSQEAYRIHCFH